MGTPETVVAPETPQAAPVAPVLALGAVVTPVAVPEQDFIQKVAQFKPKVDAATAAGTFREFEVITDPVAREAAINKYKEAQSFGTKAQQRTKELERQLQETQQWSPERIQQLLNNPQFVQAAQQVAGTTNQNPPGQSEEEYSALNDKESQKLQKVDALEAQINELKQAKFQAIISQTDAQLMAKYGEDYNPQEINETFARLAQMQPHEVREYIYKAIKHDDNVRRSYSLRDEELKKLNQEKINSFSSTGTAAVNNEGKPVKEKGENDLQFIARLGQFNLTRSRQK